jgi:outer membrane protein assembly factor BamB
MQLLLSSPAPRRLGVALLASVALLFSPWLVGCSGDKPKPTALEALQASTFGAAVAWTTKLDRIHFPLSMTEVGGRVGVASSSGEVALMRVEDGTVVWRTDVGAPITAGVGYDGQRAAVVTRNNELVVLDGVGQVKWRATLNTQVASAPFLAGERVFVLGVDRNVHAYDALDGRYVWALQRPGEALGLLSTGVVSSFGDVLLVGQGPRLASMDPLRGTINYEVPLATPRGTNEIERLADLVGPASRIGNETFCMRSFQATVGCIQASRGAVVWSKNVTGTQAVAADAQILVAADGRDRVQAWRSSNGDVLWSHDRVLNRVLSGAALIPKAAVFGDGQGHVHFFDRTNGATLQRLATDGTPIVGKPTVVGRTMLVANRSGQIQGIRHD